MQTQRLLRYSLTIFSLLFVSAIIIQDARAQISVDVWTNKGGRGQGNLDGGTYTVGEYISICFSINANVDKLRFHIITPDGRDIVYYDNRINAGTYCLEGVEMGPGVHTGLSSKHGSAETLQQQMKYAIT
jgi:uncharacterized protein YfaP (DUF2135 family)